jgi:hypothetical protein
MTAKKLSDEVKKKPAFAGFFDFVFLKAKS